MLALIGPLGPVEIALIALVALLIFGKRLPEVARSLGRGVVEFKKGLRGVEDEIEKAGKKKESEEEEKPSNEDSQEN